MSRLVLASASPRRRELLAQIGLDFDVRPADIDESPRAEEAPLDYVRRLSAEKAAAVEASADELVIAADTTVVIDGCILGKPVDDDDARRMLRLLSARTHEVLTGVTIRLGDDVLTAASTTGVTFVEVTDELMEWYVGLGEPADKAGAYAIQGAGAVLVDRVDGSVSNVIGLPLTLLAAMTERLGRPLLSPSSSGRRSPRG
jgi:septum formation protein